MGNDQLMFDLDNAIEVIDDSDYSATDLKEGASLSGRHAANSGKETLICF